MFVVLVFTRPKRTLAYTLTWFSVNFMSSSYDPMIIPSLPFCVTAFFPVRAINWCFWILIKCKYLPPRLRAPLRHNNVNHIFIYYTVYSSKVWVYKRKGGRCTNSCTYVHVNECVCVCVCVSWLISVHSREKINRLGAARYGWDTFELESYLHTHA